MSSTNDFYNSFMVFFCTFYAFIMKVLDKLLFCVQQKKSMQVCEDIKAISDDRNVIFG